MTQFLEWLENSSDVQNDILNWETVKKNAVEKEKEQIIDFTNSFYDDCVMEGGGLKQSAEEYYNQTYNQNK